MGDQVQLEPELIQSNQVVNPMRDYREKRERWRLSQELFNCALMRAHGTWWLFSNLDVFKSRGGLLGLCLEYAGKVDEDLEIKNE